MQEAQNEENSGLNNLFWAGILWVANIKQKTVEIVEHVWSSIIQIFLMRTIRSKAVWTTKQNTWSIPGYLKCFLMVLVCTNVKMFVATSPETKIHIVDISWTEVRYK